MWHPEGDENWHPGDGHECGTLGVKDLGKSVDLNQLNADKFEVGRRPRSPSNDHALMELGGANSLIGRAVLFAVIDDTDASKGVVTAVIKDNLANNN